MSRPPDEIVLTKLVERGHLTGEEAARIRAEFETAQTVVGDRNEDRPSLLDQLIESELVPPDVIAELAGEIDFGELEPADSDAGFPFPELDRFQILGLLGAGGMGQVFKAHDRELNRVVAIKVFTGGDDNLRRRFAVEARSQAKLNHPNICEIYDVGRVDDRRFIVMQYIDGGSLKDLAPEMTLDRKVRLLRDVSMAVHEAHRIGLIHRDLKPGNVMIATGGDQPPVPYVVDFGIARDIDGPEMTVTGDLLGSPAFMAPEQAAGQSKIDRRTDVYALGATLYAVLTGRPPLQGRTAFDTLMKVQLEDPPPLRNLDRSIPQDLDSIVLKALEKDPQRRYPSARELADDLDRFLDGRPVAARPIGPWRRTVKWARRNRALAAGLAVLVLSVVVATGIGLRASAVAREKQRLTLLFGTEAQRLDGMMRIAHLLPLHDVRPDRERVRARMRWILDQQQGVRGDARAPGWYALGRGHLVLGEIQQARELLSDAWEAGFQSPDVAFAYGLTLGRIYDEERMALGGIRDPEERKQRVEELRTELRDPAVELLNAATDVEGYEQTYVQGMLASYEGDYERAIELARETIETAPHQYEAWMLLGESALRTVGKARDQGDDAAVDAAIETADSAFTEASRLARSHPKPYSRHCTLWGMVMGMRLYTGDGDVESALDRAVASCDRALLADPSRVSERHNKAICYRQMAESLIRSGGDPTPYLELGRESIRGVIEVEPDNVSAHVNLAESYAVATSWFDSHDPDDRPVGLETALEWSRLGVESGVRAVELDSESVPAYRALGTAALIRIPLVTEAGTNPREVMTIAESSLERATRLDPQAVYSVNNLAWAYFKRAEYEIFVGGEDPLPALDESIAASRRALELRPSHLTAVNVLLKAEIMKARALRLAGEDPGETLDEALATAEALTASHPMFMAGRVSWVSVMAERALDLSERGGDPSELVDLALDEVGRIRSETASLKGLRWDWAILKTLAARRSVSPSDRRRLSREAVALLDDIPPTRRFPDWEQRRADAARAASL